MNGTRMKGAVAIVAFAGMALGASALQAQAGPSQDVDVEKALRYEAAAERVGTTMEFFDEAAKYWEEAASLRPEGDCQAVQDMVNASRLKFYMGDEGKAQSLLQKAGEIAMAYGDVGTAAEVFLDAAWIAWTRGQRTVVNSLIAKAQKLAHSPLLEPSQRAALLSRISAEAD